MAKYYFGICCNNKETKVIGHNDFYKIGPTPIDGMVDWLYVSGNQYKLIKFTLGVGNRDDPPPLPTENEAQKELGELKIILSTFRFTD